MNDAVVCRYYPAGNVIFNGGNQMFKANVFEPSKCGKTLERPEIKATGGGVRTFEVPSQGDCSCGSGECQAFYEESGEMSCSSSVMSRGTIVGEVGDKDYKESWTHTCTCSAHALRSAAADMMNRTAVL